MKLLCLGDIAFGNNKLITKTWPLPHDIVPGSETRILFNWELPMGITMNKIPRSGGPRLLSFPGATKILKMWSPGFATLANNHILDAGIDGLDYTIESLNQFGFITLGAGRNLDEIEKVVFWETKHGKLAIINWVFQETHPDWMAIPGPNCWPGLEKAKAIVRNCKSEADWTIVICHWSDELIPYPPSNDRILAREIANMGVDLIIGHHPHVVRGLEVINSCPVFYSLGNFYFSLQYEGRIMKQAPRNREGLGVLIEFNKGQNPSYDVISFWQMKGLVVSDPFQRAKRQLKIRSKPLERYQGSTYTNWRSIESAHFFNNWNYFWNFGIWNTSLKEFAKLLYSKILCKKNG